MIPLIGHHQVLNQLRQIYVSKNIASSYIFYGQKGIGKYQAAVFFAKLLNCLHPTSENNPCNSCGSCVKINANVHPDFLTVSSDVNQIKVDSIRSMLQQVVHEPLIANYRVVIIDDADKLNVVAGNTLLKPIEEPLTRTVYILVSHHLHQMLTTILSRSQKIAFQPLSVSDLNEYLNCQDDKRELLTDDLKTSLVRQSHGSIGELQLFLDEQILQKLDQLWMLTDGVLSKNFSQEFLSNLDQFSKQEPLIFSLNQLMLLFRDALVYKTTGNVERCFLPQQMKLTQKLTQNYPLSILIGCIDLVYEFLNQLSFYPSHLQFWEALMGVLGDRYELCASC